MFRRLRSGNTRVFFVFFGMNAAAGLIGFLLSGFAGFKGIHLPTAMLSRPMFFALLAVAMLFSSLACTAVWCTEDVRRNHPLRLYLIHLAVYILWPIFFVWLKWYFWSFLLLLLMLYLLIVTVYAMRKLHETSFFLLLPYLAMAVYFCYWTLMCYIKN